MNVITTGSSKGGCGKTSLTINLAVCATKRGLKVVIVDADKLGSAETWGDIRKENGFEAPTVVGTKPARIEKTLHSLNERGFDLCFVDTGAGEIEAVNSAAKFSDLIIVPLRASSFDALATMATADALERHNGRTWTVVNALKHYANYAGPIMSAFSARGIQVCPITVGDYVEFTNAANVGMGVLETKPRGQAAHDMVLLQDWLLSRLKD